MTKAELLHKVKVALGNIPSHLDETIELYIDEVIQYMMSAGVSTKLLNEIIDPRCTGCIIRGVADLWNYGNGDTKLSEYFYQRCDQLRGVVIETVVEINNNIYYIDENGNTVMLTVDGNPVMYESL